MREVIPLCATFISTRTSTFEKRLATEPTSVWMSRGLVGRAKPLEDCVSFGLECVVAVSSLFFGASLIIAHRADPPAITPIKNGIRRAERESNDHQLVFCLAGFRVDVSFGSSSGDS